MGGAAPPRRRLFVTAHRADPTMVVAVAAAVLAAMALGFGLDMVKRAGEHTLHFPLVVHLHAIAYSGWLALFAIQVAMIRSRRPALHRRLGRAAPALLVAMAVLGPLTAWNGIAGNPPTCPTNGPHG